MAVMILGDTLLTLHITYEQDVLSCVCVSLRSVLSI